MRNLFSETATAAPSPVQPYNEPSIKDDPLTVSIPLHKNKSILDYIETRVFSGFNIKIHKDKLTVDTSDSTLIEVLYHSKLHKNSDDEYVSINIETLLPKRSLIKKVARDRRYQYEIEVNDLWDALNSVSAFSDPAVKERLSQGYACYTDIPVLFPRGTEVVTMTPSGLLGGIVESCNEVSSMFGVYFNIMLSIMVPTNKGIHVGNTSFKIPNFVDKVPISKLPVRPILEKEKEALTERGKIFRDFTNEPTAASYVGNLTIPTWMRDYVICADGRVMVDSVNFAQIESDFYYDMMRQFNIDHDDLGSDLTVDKTTVDDENLWRCYPRVHGFSMRLKRWGWIDVQNLTPVKWRDDAFSQLVLEPKIKKTVLHLVRHYGNSFTDFIEGKSGGLVFLLHGPSGVGKTLTAEAVADTLHRPLYSVSVGELGVSPEELETKLRRILDLAFQWNAVLLLDEADIFMEARDTNNVDRNAMVSIFLRLLEYYSGVLFLTTNRVKSFDQAFFSRISLAISYPELKVENRYQIWTNILTSAGIAWNVKGINTLDIHRLAGYEVNGRNIKTAVRIAQTMASGDGREVTTEDFVEILSMTEQFVNDVRK